MCTQNWNPFNVVNEVIHFSCWNKLEIEFEAINIFVEKNPGVLHESIFWIFQKQTISKSLDALSQQEVDLISFTDDRGNKLQVFTS